MSINSQLECARRHAVRTIASALVLAALLGTAQAQSRWVFINGQRMSDAQVLELARANCTSDIPNGSYWLNWSNGAWGYAGNPVVQGVLGDPCRGGSPGGGVNQDGTRGPFATLRRADEVANQFRSQGMRAVAFHNGDGYYVRVPR
jgi:hypothetical protein